MNSAIENQNQIGNNPSQEGISQQALLDDIQEEEEQPMVG